MNRQFKQLKKGKARKRTWKKELNITYGVLTCKQI